MGSTCTAWLTEHRAVPVGLHIAYQPCLQPFHSHSNVCTLQKEFLHFKNLSLRSTSVFSHESSSFLSGLLQKIYKEANVICLEIPLQWRLLKQSCNSAVIVLPRWGSSCFMGQSWRLLPVPKVETVILLNANNRFYKKIQTAFHSSPVFNKKQREKLHEEELGMPLIAMLTVKIWLCCRLLCRLLNHTLIGSLLGFGAWHHKIAMLLATQDNY